MASSRELRSIHDGDNLWGLGQGIPKLRGGSCSGELEWLSLANLSSRTRQAITKVSPELIPRETEQN